MESRILERWYVEQEDETVALETRQLTEALVVSGYSGSHAKKTRAQFRLLEEPDKRSHITKCQKSRGHIFDSQYFSCGLLGFNGIGETIKLTSRIFSTDRGPKSFKQHLYRNFECESSFTWHGE